MVSSGSTLAHKYLLRASAMSVDANATCSMGKRRITFTKAALNWNNSITHLLYTHAALLYAHLADVDQSRI